MDFDNDGRQDILLTALADRPFLLRNRSPSSHHWLKVRLEGTHSNRNGYGAWITVRSGDWSTRAQCLCPTGFLSQGDPRVHFGLGSRATVDTLEVRWPSGARQILTHLHPDQILTVREPL